MYLTKLKMIGSIKKLIPAISIKEIILAINRKRKMIYFKCTATLVLILLT